MTSPITTETFYILGGVVTTHFTSRHLYNSKVRFSSKCLPSFTYSGTAEAETVDEATQKAVDAAMVSRAAQFNEFRVEYGFRPVDEFTPILAGSKV